MEKSVSQYSPLTLAYIGDAIYELVIRTKVVRECDMPVNKLHRKATELVNAARQSAMIRVIEPMLTEEEAHIYHRGRNAKANTKAKNAGIQDYRRATGFEAVMGYLYLKGDTERMTEQITEGLKGTENM